MTAAAGDAPFPDDLSPQTVAAALPDRPVRLYPALLSTEADALAWARGDAPHGAVVAAVYQAAPRGRGGLPWKLDPQRDLGFSVVLRPDLPPHREGWVYTVGALALSDVLGTETSPGAHQEARIEWPDEVLRDGERVAALGAQTEPEPEALRWAVLTFWARGRGDRAALLARLVEALEQRLRADVPQALDDYRMRCVTLGRQVAAHLVPMGPSGPKVTGRAVDLRDDGALVIETGNRRRLAVPPQNLGELREAL